MFWFKDRLRLSRLFERWAAENDMRVCGAGMLAYLQINGLLNEEKAQKFVEGEEQLREVRGQLKKEQERTMWAVEKLHRALEQMKNQVEACDTCAHGKSPLPCTGDPNPVDLCDTCQRECVCKDCKDHEHWVWNGGGEK